MTDSLNVGTQMEVSHNETDKNVMVQASPGTALEFNVSKNGAYVSSNLKEDPFKFKETSNGLHCEWHTNFSCQYNSEGDN